jgi:hypothetical protein
MNKEPNNVGWAYPNHGGYAAKLTGVLHSLIEHLVNLILNGTWLFGIWLVPCWAVMQLFLHKKQWWTKETMVDHESCNT